MRPERRRAVPPAAPALPSSGGPRGDPAATPAPADGRGAGAGPWAGEILARALERSWAAASGRLVPAVLVARIDRADLLAEAAGAGAVLALRDAMVDRLRGLVRLGDMVVVHGWDGWAVALDGLPAHRDAELVAERLANAVSRRWVVPGAPPSAPAHQLTLSIGLASPADGGDGLDTVVRAEGAAHRASAAGGDRILVASGPGDPAPARAHLQLVADLRAALLDDQFELTWQPLVTLGPEGGTDTVGVRWASRVTWRHPRLGRLHGPRFVPLLVSAGLGPAYAELILARAAGWAAEAGFAGGAGSTRGGASVRVSVAVDAPLVAPVAGEVAAAVHRHSRRHRLDPGQLGLDFDWGAVLGVTGGRDSGRGPAGDGVDLAGSWLEPLRTSGVPVAATGIDPSLTTLDQLTRHDGLTSWHLAAELARAGTSGGPTDPATPAAELARAGVAAAVAAAGERGVELVATGVEDEVVATWFRRLGVVWAEGRWAEGRWAGAQTVGRAAR